MAPEFAVPDAGDGGALGKLFERAELACYCRYWNFTGDKNAWLARSALEPEISRSELALELTDPSRVPCGVVARRDGDVIGWMRILSLENARKVYDQRLYRALPCFTGDRRGGFAVACFLVDPKERRNGIARGLLRTGIEAVRAAGGRFIEAFPRRADPVADAELFMGPFPLFAEEGFRTVNDFGPYPVLRLSLDGG